VSGPVSSSSSATPAPTPAPTGPDGPPVYQLRVWLRGVSPMVWRRLLVRGDTTLAELHETLQVVLGWTDEHLHRFRIHGQEFASPRNGAPLFDDARRVRLTRFGFRLRSASSTSTTSPTAGGTRSASRPSGPWSAGAPTRPNPNVRVRKGKVRRAASAGARSQP
jgi:Plasmid pRiA4b ORF-3-like protein